MGLDGLFTKMTWVQTSTTIMHRIVILSDLVRSAVEIGQHH